MRTGQRFSERLLVLFYTYISLQTLFTGRDQNVLLLIGAIKALKLKRSIFQLRQNYVDYLRKTEMKIHVNSVT